MQLFEIWDGENHVRFEPVREEGRGPVRAREELVFLAEVRDDQVEQFMQACQWAAWLHRELDRCHDRKRQRMLKGEWSTAMEAVRGLRLRARLW